MWAASVELTIPLSRVCKHSTGLLSFFGFWSGFYPHLQPQSSCRWLSLTITAEEQVSSLCKIHSWQSRIEFLVIFLHTSKKERFWGLLFPGRRALPLIYVKGQGNGTFTHLVELNPLFIPLGVGVWHPQSSKLCSEEIGWVPFHGRDAEAENPRGNAFWAVGQIVYNREKNIFSERII